MKIDDLKPGLYKIAKKENTDDNRLLRVVDKGKAQKYYFGASIKGYHPSKIENLNDFVVVANYAKKPELKDCKITLNFTDQDGSNFTIPLKEVNEVAKVFVALPWIKKYFAKS